jgi:hypothetical protein
MGLGGTFFEKLESHFTTFGNEILRGSSAKSVFAVVVGLSVVLSSQLGARRRCRTPKSGCQIASARSQDPPVADSPSKIRLRRTHHAPLTTRHAPLTANAARLHRSGAHPFFTELPSIEAGRSARQVPHDGASGARKKGSPAHWTDRRRNRRGTRARKKTEVIGIDRWVSILSGCLSHGVEAWSSKGSCPPWLVEHRRASPGQRQPTCGVSSCLIQ